MFIVRKHVDLQGVVFVQFDGKPTDEELEVYLAAERQRLNSPEETQPAVTVLHLTDSWTAVQRKRMKDFEVEHATKTAVAQLALAMIVPNALVRGGLTAYFWLAPADYPTKMVAGLSEAYEFVASQLKEAGLPVPGHSEYLRHAKCEWEARVARPGVGLALYDPNRADMG